MGFFLCEDLARPCTRHLIGDSMLASFMVDYGADGGGLIEQYSGQAIHVWVVRSVFVINKATIFKQLWRVVHYNYLG